MVLYLFLYFFLLIGAYLTKRSSFILYLLLLLMSMMIGFRGEAVGTDTPAYMQLYEDIGNWGYKGFPEPLYGLLGACIYSFGGSFHFFQTILTFAAFCCTAHVIKRQSPNYCLSLFLLVSLYFFSYTMNIYREMIACFISVYGCLFLTEEKEYNKLKYFLVILLCAGFHYSAMILFSILLLRRIPINGRIVWLGILLSLMIGLIDLSNILSPLMGGYGSYIERGKYVREGSKLVMGFFLCLYWIIGFWYIYKNSSESYRNSIYMRMFFCGVVLSNILVRQDLGLRIALYFVYPMIIGLPIYVYTQTNNILKSQILIILYTSLYFCVFSYMDSADAIPYTID